mgnify:CR=1 FL=1
MDENILEAGYALEALRETGYKNTAYAISELLDNSIDAGAMKIDVVALEEQVLLPSGISKPQITSMAVIDNGSGIQKEILAKCLSIGYGTKKDAGDNEDSDSIGKFGYGLKGGSISQCKRVEVYTWQNGELPQYTYLDLDLIKEGTQTVIHSPVPQPLPAFLSGCEPSVSGTAIVWQKCDKLDYKSYKGLFTLMNGDLSRIFRNFLDDDNTYGVRREMKLNVVDIDGQSIHSQDLVANDPTYLLKPNTLSSISENKAEELNFQGDRYLGKRATNIEHENYEKEVAYLDSNKELKTTTIKFIFSYAETSIQALGGSSDWGKHYARNDSGISFMRSAREIEHSEKGLIANQDERNRWWGAEIRFGPELDELFGVDAAKQNIRNIRRVRDDLIKDYSEEAESDDTQPSLIKRLNLLVNNEVKINVKQMMDIITARGKGKRKTTDGGKSPQDRINEELKKKDTKTKSSEEAKRKQMDEKRKEVEDAIRKADPALTDSEVKAKVEARLDRIINFGTASWDQFGAFMQLISRGSGLDIELNLQHKFYTEYYDKFATSNPEAQEALKIIIQGYARAQDELAPVHDYENVIFNKLLNRWGAFIDEHIEKAKE